MTVGKVIEISAESPESFEKAIENGIAEAAETVKDMKSAWVKDQLVTIEDGKVTEFRVHMGVTVVVKK